MKRWKGRFADARAETVFDPVVYVVEVYRVLFFGVFVDEAEAVLGQEYKCGAERKVNLCGEYLLTYLLAYRFHRLGSLLADLLS